MSTKKSTAAGESQGVHTSAQTDPATQAAPVATGCTGCGDCAKPKHHQPSALLPRDQFTGKAGRFIRDPQTGERKPAITTEG